eukprot:1158342-Pleurochrysis_carterae.AAC.2
MTGAHTPMFRTASETQQSGQAWRARHVARFVSDASELLLLALERFRRALSPLVQLACLVPHLNKQMHALSHSLTSPAAALARTCLACCRSHTSRQPPSAALSPLRPVLLTCSRSPSKFRFSVLTRSASIRSRTTARHAAASRQLGRLAPRVRVTDAVARSALAARLDSDTASSKRQLSPQSAPHTRVPSLAASST